MCIYISINDEKTKKQPFQPKSIYKKQPLMEALDVLQKQTFLKVIVKLITLSNLFTQERHY